MKKTEEKKESKAQKRKAKKAVKIIDEMKKEIEGNDVTLTKNLTERRLQIQIGLYRAGLPQGSQMYDKLLENMRSQAKELELQISLPDVMNPMFAYQTTKEWMELMQDKRRKELDGIKSNIIEVEKNVETVTQLVDEQTERIRQHRSVLVDELAKRGVKIAPFVEPDKSKTDYIG